MWLLRKSLDLPTEPTWYVLWGALAHPIGFLVACLLVGIIVAAIALSGVLGEG